MGARICLLYDGFFSFAVVRQVFLLFILLCYMDDYGNYDGFFSFAVVRQLIFYFFLMRKDNQSNQKQNNKAKYNANTSANGGRYRHLIVSGFIREEHRHTICKATRNDNDVRI